MKDFEKGLSPSKLNANRNLSPSGTEENNENDSSVDKLISQFESHRIVHGKNFMSGAPRKKILAEICEIPSNYDDQNHENSNLELEKSVQKEIVSDGVVSCSEQKHDLSVKAYDPLTNYISPRPKYLRFNPNRRREILKRLENEAKEELNSSPDSAEADDFEESTSNEVQDSSLSPKVSEEDNDSVFNGYDVVEEEEEEEIEEEEEEEIEEETGWCVRGVLKLLLTLIACSLSTSYICSMNSPTSSPIQQAVWNFKDSGVVIKNGSLELALTKLRDDGFFEVEHAGNHNLIEKVEVDEESYGEIDESLEAKIVENLEQFENFEIDENLEAKIVENLEQFENFEIDESLEAEDEENDDDSYGEMNESFEAEIVETLKVFEREVIGNENEDNKEIAEEAAEGGVRAAQFEFKADDYEHLIDSKAGENIDGGVIRLDEYEASGTSIIGSGEVDFNPQSSRQLIGAETVESEETGSNWLQAPELLLESDSNEITMEFEGENETGSLEIAASHGELSDSMDEVDEIHDDAEFGKEKSEFYATTVIGLSAVLIVLTSVAIIYHLKKSRSKSSEEFEPVQKPNFAVEENVNPVRPSTERKVEFLARVPLSSNSMREAPREFSSHVHAPTIELIGEMFVGQPTNLRGSGKFKMTVSEDECNASLDMIHGKLTQPVSARSPPSATELHPTTSNTSHGSITTKRKGGRSGEDRIETTPLRRSSRLRSRSAVIHP